MQYSDIYDFTNLYNAYLKARRQKRYRREVMEFSYNLDAELITLQNELIRKTYKVGEYRQHTVVEKKKRRIVAAKFRDRVFQHALNAVIEQAFEHRMVYDSYACRVGKGTHEAVKRLSYFMGKADTAYYLKMDIKAYFASVNLGILKAIIKRYIADPDILWLIDVLLDSSPVPGMPIGNLMSQLFANVYLHELDHHCKNVLGIKYYIRYMDDIIVLAGNKPYLKAVMADVESFIAANLALELNPKSGIGRCKDGIEFVGYRVWRSLRMIKKQSIFRMKKKVRAFKSGKISGDKFMASVGSWMGHSVNTASYRSVMRIALDGMHEMNRRVNIAKEAAANGL